MKRNSGRSSDARRGLLTPPSAAAAYRKAACLPLPFRLPWGVGDGIVGKGERERLQGT